MSTSQKTHEQFRVERHILLDGNEHITDAATFTTWSDAFRSFSESVLKERDGCRWTITELESGYVCAIVEF